MSNKVIDSLTAISSLLFFKISFKAFTPSQLSSFEFTKITLSVISKIPPNIFWARRRRSLAIRSPGWSKMCDTFPVIHFFESYTHPHTPTPPHTPTSPPHTHTHTPHTKKTLETHSCTICAIWQRISSYNLMITKCVRITIGCLVVGTVHSHIFPDVSVRRTPFPTQAYYQRLLFFSQLPMTPLCTEFCLKIIDFRALCAYKKYIISWQLKLKTCILAFSHPEWR